MSILPIVTYNDPVLRKKTEPIKDHSEFVSELVDNMIETMYNSDGVGLAAPQIGKSLRLFVMDGDPIMDEEDEKYGVLVFINPEIVEKKGKKIAMNITYIFSIKKHIFYDSTTFFTFCW